MGEKLEFDAFIIFLGLISCFTKQLFGILLASIFFLANFPDIGINIYLIFFLSVYYIIYFSEFFFPPLSIKAKAILIFVICAILTFLHLKFGLFVLEEPNQNAINILDILLLLFIIFVWGIILFTKITRNKNSNPQK